MVAEDGVGLHLPVSDVPDELGQHVEEGDEQVSDAEVHNHHVHPAQLLPAIQTRCEQCEKKQRLRGV